MNRLFIFLVIIGIGATISPYKNRVVGNTKIEKLKFEVISKSAPDRTILVVRGDNNATVCQDEKIILTPEVIDPEEMYEWKDDDGNVIAIGDQCIINNLDTTHTYTLTIHKSDNTEKVTNGGFESGNTDFSSDYGYVVDRKKKQDELHPEGFYGVGTNPNNYHNNFASMPDHSGSGNMMIINAGSEATDIIWSQQINVSSNTKYAFSFWGSSVHPTNPARLSFYISDGVLTAAQINQPEIYRIGEEVVFTTSTNDWNKYFKIWDSKTFSGTKWISVVNSNTIASGNDFAIDDISFTGTNYQTYDIRVEVAPSLTGGGTETIPAVCEGTEILMDMNAIGSVNQYIWKKGTTILSNDKRRYTISDPLVNDSGTYTCTAESECGDVTKTFNVTVNKNISTNMINRKNP